MNTLRTKTKITILMGALAGAGVACSGLIACSSDDTVTTGDGGGTTPEGSSTDSPSNPDTFVPPIDAGPDRVIVEAGTLKDFVDQNAAATCTRYKECCNAGTDAGFNTAKCQADFGSSGWEQSITEVTVAQDGGRLSFDPAKGTDCLTGIRNMTCNNATATEFRSVWETCFEAVTGTQAVNSPCVNSAECVNTAYCDTTADGGTCTALKGAGAVCAFGPQPFVGNECSYRGGGTTQCNDPGDGGQACGPAFANGTVCGFDFDCQSGACSPTDDSGAVFQCAATANFLFGICDLYKQ